MRLGLKSLRLVALALAGASLAARSVVVVAPGEFAVPVLFGAVRPAALPEGPHLVNPLASHPRLTVRGAARGRRTGAARSWR